MTWPSAAAHAESNLDHVKLQYGYNPALAAHWLVVVAGLGYPLSEIEQQAAADARREVEEDSVAADATAEGNADTD